MEKRPKWPRSLVIVRHGQSALNVAKDLEDENLEEALKKLRSVRDVDIELTQRGHWQAHETGKFLQGEPFDICFASPYTRTIQTAEDIVSKLQHQPRIYTDNRIREKEFGVLHGYTTGQIRTLFPFEFESREREGKYWYRLPGGENYPDVEQRLHSFLDKLVRDYAGKNVLVVTHQVPVKLFRALFEHLGEKEVLALEDTPNCGIEKFLLDTSGVPEGRMKLSMYNNIAYELSQASQ